MKKKNIVFCLFIFFCFASDSAAQEVYERRGQAIYLELFGSGFIYSLNYETRFQQKTEGLGARIGVSYIGEWLTVPANINFLLGKKGKSHFLELGAGVTYINYNEPQTFGSKTIEQQWAPAFTIMYRLHPRYGKFFFKIGITPLYGNFLEEEEEKQLIPLFGIAFGRAF